jgi:hypothetical protein
MPATAKKDQPRGFARDAQREIDRLKARIERNRTQIAQDTAMLETLEPIIATLTNAAANGSAVG